MLLHTRGGYVCLGVAVHRGWLCVFRCCCTLGWLCVQVLVYTGGGYMCSGVAVQQGWLCV